MAEVKIINLKRLSTGRFSANKKFKIKGFEGQDDYASMAEVIGRRFDEYYKAEKADEGFGKLPDAELADVAVGVRIFRNGQLDGREGFLLDKAGPYRHKQMGAEQKDDHGRPPQVSIDKGNKGLHGVQHRQSSLGSPVRRFCIFVLMYESLPHKMQKCLYKNGKYL